jgi:hypothetical protein
MTRARGHKYHLFLSHVWSTGQDACATIKLQLQRLLPHARIFLDVDDLADIGELELYVQKTAAMLMFLSRGYLLSPNCLREVRMTILTILTIRTILTSVPLSRIPPLSELSSGGTHDYTYYTYHTYYTLRIVCGRYA